MFLWTHIGPDACGTMDILDAHVVIGTVDVCVINFVNICYYKYINMLISIL